MLLKLGTMNNYLLKVIIVLLCNCLHSVLKCNNLSDAFNREKDFYMS